MRGIQFGIEEQPVSTSAICLSSTFSGEFNRFFPSERKDDFESVVMEHLRLNGAYWGLTTLDILGKLDAVDQDEVISWFTSPFVQYAGGFGGNIGHDPHMLYTLSAIQVLALFDKLHVLDVNKVSSCILHHIFWNLSMSRSSCLCIYMKFVALIALTVFAENLGNQYWYMSGSFALLRQLDKIDVGKAVKYIVSCKNVDGGFGCTPGAESHAGQTPYVGKLREECISIAKDSIQPQFLSFASLLIMYEAFSPALLYYNCYSASALQQVKSGGLNGRPEKLPDVCYSWWVLSNLIMIDRVHWIDKEKLAKFILDCQKGGISDRPDDAVDVFHTYFGVAGLSLLEYSGLRPIDPAYALPVSVVNKVILPCRP
ncbi:hypothetical protein KY290_010470 [Solanum tuberosum]|uniref:Geranylgeranyl transferase type-2 subunit beta n=1 Tax=Solanum tuberosum TaxID=4113 RepID=A0ABQ7VXV4_SOLTU|nr:hypothetical protein KY290_010470 [Solanum tuberosum]